MERPTGPQRARRNLRRAYNAFRKIRAGLRLFGENISPEVQNDLYVAHLSIYRFFSTFTVGASVLDVGCGCGYGTHYLAEHGASRAVGFDLDPRNISYARKRFRHSTLEYMVANAETLGSLDTPFDLIVSSNLFEHLFDVHAALRAVQRNLLPTGTFALAVPPIYDAASLAANQMIPYHRTNLYVAEWLATLRGYFGSVEMLDQIVPDGVHLDFADPFPSRVETVSFELRSRTTPIPARGTIGAVFLSRKPQR